MPRRPRSELPDGFFHVVSRGVAGCAVFRDDDDRSLFARLLDAVERRVLWICHAFCLMGTHYHLVVEADVPRLARGMHWLNGVYAQRFNRRYARRGHLFENRYSAFIIHDEDHLRATSLYVLANPVRAGLCTSPEDWSWSGPRPLPASASVPGPPEPAPTTRAATSRPCDR